MAQLLCFKSKCKQWKQYDFLHTTERRLVSREMNDTNFLN